MADVLSYVMLTQARLRELLHYDPETGEFSRYRANRAKKVVGRMSEGYLAIGVDYGRYQAHRLAFLYMTGKWPKSDVDHINGIRRDNRWINLREATRSQNNLNRKLDRRNKSGHTGVFWNKNLGQWQAHFTFSFKTKEEAVAARQFIVKHFALLPHMRS